MRHHPQVRLAACIAVAWAAAVWATEPGDPEPTSTGSASADVVLVLGAHGTQQYQEQFQRWRQQWDEVCRQAGVGLTIVEPSGEDPQTQKDRVRQAIQAGDSTGAVPLWLVLIGHGTFDGRQAKMNLDGPDFTSGELAGWLQQLDRPVAVVNCTASSAPFLQDVSGQDRVVITATRSGHEYQFARFGGFFAEAVASAEADLDKDGQTSLLEAYLYASRQVQAYYREQGLLATEHALIDDNSDQRGTPAEWFDGVVVLRDPVGDAVPDGSLAHQWHLLPTKLEAELTPEDRQRRAELEQQLTQLRRQKETFTDSEYLERLESVLVPLAEIYMRADQAGQADPVDPEAGP